MAGRAQSGWADSERRLQHAVARPGHEQDRRRVRLRGFLGEGDLRQSYVLRLAAITVIDAVA